MFFEPPDPQKEWLKGLIILIVLVIIYTITSQGMRMMSERGRMAPPDHMLKFDDKN